MYASSWMLLRPFGAMNGLRGGWVIPPTGDRLAAEPSNGAADPPMGSPGIGTTGRPGVCAAAGPVQAATARSAAPVTIITPQVRWRILRRAYARLRGEWIRS